MSLFIRTYLILSVALVMAFLATLFVIDNSFEAEDGRIFKAQSRAEAQLTLRWLQQHPQDAWLTAMDNYQPLLGFTVSLLNTGQLANKYKIKTPSSGIDETVYTDSWEDWWSIYRVPDSDLHLLIKYDEQGISRDDLLEIVLPMLSLFVTLGVGIFLLSKKTVSLIGELITTTSAIGKGEWNVRANTHVPEPIRSMAVSVNSMAERLQRTMQDQQIAIGAIPHEIRSPIARMRFALDMTRQATDAETVRERIEDVDRYLDDLQDTVESTLDLIREKQRNALLAGQFDATQLVGELQHYCTHNKHSYGKKLEIVIDNTQPVHGDIQLLRQAVINLIDNALHYATATVNVTVSTGQDISQVIVDDDGPGVPLEYRPEIFSPFYRVDKSRTRSSGGVGLGLALVRLIIDAHQGEVLVQDSPLGGARFTLRW